MIPSFSLQREYNADQVKTLTAENVDEDALDFRIREENLERLLDRLRGRTSAEKQDQFE